MTDVVNQATIFITIAMSGISRIVRHETKCYEHDAKCYEHDADCTLEMTMLKSLHGI